MIRSRLALAALLSALPLTAQGYTASLTSGNPIVTATAPVEVSLTLEVQDNTKLPLAVLAGQNFELRRDGKSVGTIGDSGSGDVELKAGTSLTRSFVLDVAGMVSADNPNDVTQVQLVWPGLDGALVTLYLVPDQASLDVESLDLTKVRVRLMTNHGDMVVRFYPDIAPNHVKNFVKLSKEGFYNGTRFHRVIKNFMIQGGCPETKAGATGRPGTGNPGYFIDAEFSDRPHERGTLSMARSSNPNSAGSQFFVCHARVQQLDNNYTVFGALESGTEALDSICNVKVEPSANREMSKPVEPVHLFAAVVLPGDS